MAKRSERIMHIPRASEGRGFVPPRYSAGTRRFMILVGGWYLRLFEGVRNVSLHNESTLIEELEQFYRNDHRLIIAFRHAAKEDAPVMMYALNRKLHRLIRKRNRNKLRHERIIAHARFLYGSDVLEWAGKMAAWLFPKIGCVPVQNRGSNRQGLTILRKEVREGTFPIALAPEAQVTYHMYRCSTVAPGIGSLAVWGAESAKDVTVVPIAIGYRHAEDPEQCIRSLLRRWEQQTGLSLEGRDKRPILELLGLATTLTVDLLETVYTPSREPLAHEPTLRERIVAVCEVALTKAETLAGIESEGSLLDRVFRLRYLGVEAVHPEQYDPSSLPQLGRSVADMYALEAHVYLRHAQVVDVLEYIDPSYIAPPCTAGRACEYALNLLDVVNRMEGGNINTRYSPRGKDSMVHIGTPLRLSQVLNTAPSSTRKRQLKSIMDSVHTSLDTTSKEMESHWEHTTFDS